MEKANDWLVVNLKSPGVDLGDLYASGVNPDNTTIKSKDEYVNTKTIQEKFKNPSTGQFDDKAFNKYYDAVVEGYNLFVKSKPEDPLKVPDNAWVSSPYSKGREKNMVKLSTLSSVNPFIKLKTNQGAVFGASSFGQWSKPVKSEAELAQQQKVIDYKTGKELEYTPEDMSFIGSLTNDPLVLAVHEQDVLDDNGEVKYRKGELKLDENGNPRYETLGGRKPQGRQVLSAWDTLTREGTTLNRFDFMDSDDIEKSIPGIITKNLVQILPAFIPYVGGIYTSSIIAKNLAEVGVIGYQSLAGLLSGKEVNVGNDFLGKVGTLNSGMSEYGKSSFFTLESLAGLVTDSVLQLKTQRFIAEAPLKLATIKYKAGMGGSLETIKSIGAARGMTTKQINNFVDQFAIGQNLDNYKKIADVAKWTSTAYMATTSATEIYNNAKITGLSARDSGLLYLGFTLALGKLFKSDIGEMALKGIGLSETDKIVRGVLKKELAKGSSIFTSADEAAAAMMNQTKGATVAATATPGPNKNFIMRGYEIGKRALDKLYNTSKHFDKLGESKGAFVAGLAEGAYSEGVEEVTEFAMQKGLEYIYNGLNEAGFTATEKGVKYSYTAEQLWQELMSTAIGGGLGGAIFKSFDYKKSKAPSEWTLVDAINAGYADELYAGLNKMKTDGLVPGSTELSMKPYEDSDGQVTEGVFKPVSLGDMSQQDFIVSTVKNNIDLIKNLLDNNGILEHQKVIASKNELINNITDLNIDSSIYTSLRDVTHDIVGANIELKALMEAELPDNDAIAKAKKRLSEAKAEYERLTSDESTDEFLREALFNMNGKAMAYIGSVNKDALTKQVIPEYDSYSSLVLAAESNAGLKAKVAEVDEKYSEYTKTEKFRKELKEARRALEKFTVSTPEGISELKKYSDLLSKFNNVKLFSSEEHINSNLQLENNSNLGAAHQTSINNTVGNVAGILGHKLNDNNFLTIFPRVKELLSVVKDLGYLPSHIKKSALDSMQEANQTVDKVIESIKNGIPALEAAQKNADAVYGNTDFQLLLADIKVKEGSVIPFIKALYELHSGDASKEAVVKDILTRAGYKDDFTENADPIIMMIPLSEIIGMFNTGGTNYDELDTTGNYGFNPLTLVEDVDEYDNVIGITRTNLSEDGENIIISNEVIDMIGSNFSGLTSKEFLETVQNAIDEINKAAKLKTPFDNLLGDVYEYIKAQENSILNDGADNYVNSSQDFTDTINANMDKVKQLMGAIVAMGEINPIINAFRDTNKEILPDSIKDERFLVMDTSDTSYPTMLAEIKDTLARLQYFKDLNHFNVNNTTKKLKKESALYTKLHSKELVEMYNLLDSIKPEVSDSDKVIIDNFILTFLPIIDKLTAIGEKPINDFSDDFMVEAFVELTKAEESFYKEIGSIFKLADENVKSAIFNLLMPENTSINDSFSKNSLEDTELTLNNKALYRFRILTTDPIIMYKAINGTPDKATGLPVEDLLPNLFNSPYAPYQSQTEAVIMGYVLNNTTAFEWDLFTKGIYESYPLATQNMQKTLVISAPAGSGKTTAVLGGIINSFIGTGKQLMVVAPEKTQAKVIYDSVVTDLGIDESRLNQNGALTVEELLTAINPLALKALNSIEVLDSTGAPLVGDSKINYMIANFEEYTTLIDAAVSRFMSKIENADTVISLFKDVDLLIIDEATHVPAHILYFINKLLSKANSEAAMILSGDEYQMGVSLNNTRFNMERIFSPKTSRLSTSVRSKFDLVGEAIGEIQVISEKLGNSNADEILRFNYPDINLTYDINQNVGFRITDVISTNAEALKEIEPLIQGLRNDPSATLLYITDDSNITNVTNELKAKYSDVFSRVIIETPEIAVFATANVVTPKSAQSMQATYVVIDSAPVLDESSKYKNRRIAEFYNTMLTRVKNAGVLINRGNHPINFINSPNRTANEVLKFTPESIEEFKMLEIRKLENLLNVDTTPVTRTPAKSGTGGTGSSFPGANASTLPPMPGGPGSPSSPSGASGHPTNPSTPSTGTGSPTSTGTGSPTSTGTGSPTSTGTGSPTSGGTPPTNPTGGTGGPSPTGGSPSGGSSFGGSSEPSKGSGKSKAGGSPVPPSYDPTLFGEDPGNNFPPPDLFADPDPGNIPPSVPPEGGNEHLNLEADKAEKLKKDRIKFEVEKILKNYHDLKATVVSANGFDKKTKAIYDKIKDKLTTDFLNACSFSEQLEVTANYNTLESFQEKYTTYTPLLDDLKSVNLNEEYSFTKVSYLLSLVNSVDTSKLSGDDFRLFNEINNFLRVRYLQAAKEERTLIKVDDNKAIIVNYADNGIGNYQSALYAYNALFGRKDILTEAEIEMLEKYKPLIENKRNEIASQEEQDKEDTENKDKLKEFTKRVKNHEKTLKEELDKLIIDEQFNFNDFNNFVKIRKLQPKTINALKVNLSIAKNLKSKFPELENVIKAIESYVDFVNSIPAYYKNEIEFSSEYNKLDTLTEDELIGLLSKLEPLKLKLSSKVIVKDNIQKAITQLTNQTDEEDEALDDSGIKNSAKLDDVADLSYGNLKRSNFYRSFIFNDSRKLEVKNFFNINENDALYAYNQVRAQLSGIATNKNYLSEEDIDNTTIIFESYLDDEDPKKPHKNYISAVIKKGDKELTVYLGLYSSQAPAFSKKYSIAYNNIKDYITTTPQNLNEGSEVTLTLDQADAEIFSNAYVIKNLTLTLDKDNFNGLPKDIQNLLTNNLNSETRSISNGAMFSLMIYNKDLAAAYEKGDITVSNLFKLWLKLSTENKGSNKKNSKYQTFNIQINGSTYIVREFDIQPVIYTSPKVDLRTFLKLVKGTTPTGKALREKIFGNLSNEKIVDGYVAQHISTLLKASIEYLEKINSDVLNTIPNTLIENLPGAEDTAKLESLKLILNQIINARTRAIKSVIFADKLIAGNDRIEFFERILEATKDVELKDSKGNVLSKADKVILSIPYLAQKNQTKSIINPVDIKRADKIAQACGANLTVTMNSYEKAGISILHKGKTLTAFLDSLSGGKRVVKPKEGKITPAEEEAKRQKEEAAKKKAEKEANIKATRVALTNAFIDTTALDDEAIFKLKDNVAYYITEATRIKNSFFEKILDSQNYNTYTLILKPDDKLELTDASKKQFLKDISIENDSYSQYLTPDNLTKLNFMWDKNIVQLIGSLGMFHMALPSIPITTATDFRTIFNIDLDENEASLTDIFTRNPDIISDIKTKIAELIAFYGVDDLKSVFNSSNNYFALEMYLDDFESDGTIIIKLTNDAETILNTDDRLKVKFEELNIPYFKMKDYYRNILFHNIDDLDNIVGFLRNPTENTARSYTVNGKDENIYDTLEALVTGSEDQFVSQQVLDFLGLSGEIKSILEQIQKIKPVDASTSNILRYLKSNYTNYLTDSEVVLSFLLKFVDKVTSETTLSKYFRAEGDIKDLDKDTLLDVIAKIAVLNKTEKEGNTILSTLKGVIGNLYEVIKDTIGDYTVRLKHGGSSRIDNLSETEAFKEVEGILLNDFGLIIQTYDLDSLKDFLKNSSKYVEYLRGYNVNFIGLNLDMGQYATINLKNSFNINVNIDAVMADLGLSKVIVKKLKAVHNDNVESILIDLVNSNNTFNRLNLRQDLIKKYSIVTDTVDQDLKTIWKAKRIGDFNITELRLSTINNEIQKIVNEFSSEQLDTYNNSTDTVFEVSLENKKIIITTNLNAVNTDILPEKEREDYKSKLAGLGYTIIGDIDNYLKTYSSLDDLKNLLRFSFESAKKNYTKYSGITKDEFREGLLAEITINDTNVNVIFTPTQDFIDYCNTKNQPNTNTSILTGLYEKLDDRLKIVAKQLMDLVLADTFNNVLFSNAVNNIDLSNFNSPDFSTFVDKIIEIGTKKCL